MASPNCRSLPHPGVALLLVAFCRCRGSRNLNVNNYSVKQTKKAKEKTLTHSSMTRSAVCSSLSSSFHSVNVGNHLVNQNNEMKWKKTYVERLEPQLSFIASPWCCVGGRRCHSSRSLIVNNYSVKQTKKEKKTPMARWLGVPSARSGSELIPFCKRSLDISNHLNQNNEMGKKNLWASPNCHSLPRPGVVLVTFHRCRGSRTIIIQ